MKSRLGMSAIILTLLFLPGTGGQSLANETVSTCGGGSASELAWLEELSKSLNESVGDGKSKPAVSVPEVKKTEVKNPVVVEKSKPLPEVEPDDARVEEGAPGRYDLTPAVLSRLVKSSHAAADACHRGICGRRKSKYMCYRGVKDALAGAGLVDSWWSEDAAIDAYRHRSLEKRGFKNVITEGFNSSNAPLGAVLVYSLGKYRCRDEQGGKMQCGHIETKLPNGEYCSDYCKYQPGDHYMTRKLVGVYVKE